MSFFQRFLIAGDSHGDLDAVDTIVDYADSRNADIIFDGDMSGYPTKEDGLKYNYKTFHYSLDILSKLDGYVYIIPGSHEIPSVYYNTKFPDNIIDVHKRNVTLKSRKVDNFAVVGYGGSRMTPSYIKEKEFRRIADLGEINELFFENDYYKIFLTHDSPLGYGDVSWFKRLGNGGIQALPPNAPDAECTHGGDEIISIAIESLLPNLVVSGHFHGNPIAQKIVTKEYIREERLKPGTYEGIFINPGALNRNDFQSNGGNFAEIEILDSGKIRYLGHKKVK